MDEDEVVVVAVVAVEREDAVRARDAAPVVVAGMDAAAVVAVSGDEDVVEMAVRSQGR